MKINVGAFLEMSADPDLLDVSLFDGESGDTLWEGVASELPTQYSALRLDGFDVGSGGVVVIQCEAVDE